MKTIKGFNILNEQKIESGILYLLEYFDKSINQYFDNRFGIAYLKDDFLFAEYQTHNFYSGKINRNDFDNSKYVLYPCLLENGNLKYNYYSNRIELNDEQYYKLHFLNQSLTETQQLFNNICKNDIKNNRIKTMSIHQLFAIEQTKEYYKIK
jgi:hypothetical protein